MAGLAIAHLQRLKALHRIKHVAQGEAAALVLLGRNAGTGALDVEVLTIAEAWAMDDRDASGNRLPPEVRYELQVAESLLSATHLAQTVALRHGAVVYKILAPTPFAPWGLHRFWRIWISPAEDA